MRLLSALLIWTAAAFGHAGVQFTLHPGYPAPKYFSGTNARAFFRVKLTPPHTNIEAVAIDLNGTQTLLRVHGSGTTGWSGDPDQGNGGMTGYCFETQAAIMFDSFHYQAAGAMGSTVVVRCRAKVDGAWHEATYSAPARNNAAIFGIEELEYGTVVPGSAGGSVARSRLQQLRLSILVHVRLGVGLRRLRAEARRNERRRLLRT